MTKPDIKEGARRPNKTQLKRDIKALFDLGQDLIDLPLSKLADFQLSESMRDAIDAARPLKKSALKRQLRYIAKIMQEEDIDAIRRRLSQFDQCHQQATDEQHQIEQWRDELLAGDNNLMNELVEKFSNADRQHLRQLVRNANKEIKHNKPPKSSRLLFKYLRDLQKTP